MEQTEQSEAALTRFVHALCECAERPKAPDGLVDRIEAAIQRITDGGCPRRIPADPTDADLVLAEVLAWVNGEHPPFWLKGSERNTTLAAPEKS